MLNEKTKMNHYDFIGHLSMSINFFSSIVSCIENSILENNYINNLINYVI